jgi:hypothetical protein
MIVRSKLNLVLVSSIVALTLTGCDGLPTLSLNKPKTASEVIEKYNEADTRDYTIDGIVNMEIIIGASGFNMDIPVTVDYSIDTMDELMHGTMNVDADIPMLSIGMSDEEEDDEAEDEPYLQTEFYIDGTDIYMSSDDEWQVTDLSEQLDMSYLFGELDATQFENAELVTDKKAGTYTINQPIKEYLNKDKLSEMLGDSYSEYLNSVDFDSLINSIGDSSIVYVFDKDFNLQSTYMDTISYSGTMDLLGTEMELSFSLGYNANYSNYGKVDEINVKVPKNIKDSAVETTSDDLSGTYSTYEDYDDSDYDMDYNFDSSDWDTSDWDSYGWDVETDDSDEVSY